MNLKMIILAAVLATATANVSTLRMTMQRSILVLLPISRNNERIYLALIGASGASLL